MPIPRRYIAFIGLCLAFVAHTAPGETRTAALEPGWHDDVSLQVGDRTRYFRYFVPSSLLDSKPPVVLFFHGGTQSMRSTMPPNSSGSAAWPFVAEEKGFLLLVPNGVGEDGDAFGDDQRWNDCRSDGPQTTDADDVAFVEALLDWSSDTLGHDPEAVFATGASNGGMMTYRLAQERPDLITAGAGFIANLAANSACEAQDEPVPMMVVNGTEDSWMPYDGGQVVGGGGEVVSTDETVAYWLQVNGLEPSPEIESLPELEPDEPTRVQLERYSDDQSVDRLRFYRMIDAGHAMPTLSRPISAQAESLVGPQNRDIEGAREAWAFFRQFYLTDADLGHALSGNWFDPSRNGEGFNLVAGEEGAVLFYYGADPDGERLWLISDLLTDPLTLGEEYEVTVYRTSGGRFGQPLPPSESRVNWGEATLRFEDCTHGEIGLQGEQGEELDSEVTRLLAVSNHPC